MSFSPQNVCGFLIRSRLMTPDQMQNMFQRWLAESGDQATNIAQFSKWMVTHQYVTDYQAGLLAKGHGDPNVFFLNQYKILDRLGRGRMAGVYKAMHTLGQMVAIKILPPSRAKNAQMLGRFQREARMAMRLKHPNVVRSFQIGEANGLYYLVMEYLEGETLEDILQRRKRLPPAEAVRIVHQALTGLQHIHEQGMIHRDFKPANLMLVPAPAKGEADTTVRATVKILDIGLGRALFEDNVPSGEDKGELTGEGVILGTPDYLAPEQARDPRTIDIRADIYSAGCVLYHLLTGQPPFPDSNLINQMVRHATEMPKPLQQFNPAIPDGLQQIVNYMTAKQAAGRYATPERAAQALQAFLMAESQGAKPLEEAPQMRKYLTWLETAPSEPDSLSGEIGAPAPQARPGDRPARSSRPTPTPSKHSSGERKKHRKHRHSKHANAAGAAASAPQGPHDFDVELVPISPGSPLLSSTAGDGKKTWGLTRRDWSLVGFGAGALAGVLILGYLLVSIVTYSS